MQEALQGWPLWASVLQGASQGGPRDGFQLGPRAILECCLAPWAVLTVSMKSPCSRLDAEHAERAPQEHADGMPRS